MALLVTVIDPLILPTAFGENSIPTIAVCPGASVVLEGTPVLVNPVPVMLPPVNVRLEFPVFFSVICWVSDPFTFILPKARLAGVTFNIREAETPVPDSTTVIWLSDAFELRTTDPLDLPTAVGKKPTVNCVFPFAGI
jgi:hypothetical protein